MTTTEKDRGRQFLQKVEIWRIFLEANQPLNKKKLAQIVYNTQDVNEAKKRSVQRTADMLVKLGVVVKCDCNGNILSDRVFLRKLKENPSEERFWIANPNVSYARTLSISKG